MKDAYHLVQEPCRERDRCNSTHFFICTAGPSQFFAVSTGVCPAAASGSDSVACGKTGCFGEIRFTRRNRILTDSLTEVLDGLHAESELLSLTSNPSCYYASEADLGVRRRLFVYCGYNLHSFSKTYQIPAYPDAENVLVLSSRVQRSTRPEHPE